jgi:hypothetical protein
VAKSAKKRLAATRVNPPVRVVALAKHQVVRPWTAKVIASTRRGYARFKPNLPRSETWYGSLFRKQKCKQIGTSGTYWALVDHIVGASEGELTQYVLIKVSGGLSHPRPVSVGELRQNFGVSKHDIDTAEPIS